MTEPKLNHKRYAADVWKMHLMILTIGLVLIGIIVYGYYSGDRINTVDASLLRATMKIKLETSTTNLVIEGLLGDGLTTDFQPVWEPMETAVRDFRTVVTKSNARRTFLPFQSAAVAAVDMERLDRELAAFKEKAAARFTNKKISFLDEEVDTRYRLAFKNLFVHLEVLENNLYGVMTRNLTLFRYSQTVMIILCVSLTLLAAVLLQRFAAQQSRSYAALQDTNIKLENEIAERQRSEDAVKASEERFRQLAENIKDIFWLEDVGDANKIVYISPAFKTWSGYDPSEVYNDSRLFWRCIQPDDRERVINAYREFIGGTGKFEIDFRIDRPDGIVRWIRSRGFPIKGDDGRIHRIAGLAQDITEQKRQEEQREQLVRELKDFSNAVSHDLRAPLINIKGFFREIQGTLDLVRPAFEETLAAFDSNRKKEVAAAIYEDLPEAVDFIDAAILKMESLINAILRLSRLERRELLLERLDINAIVRDTLKSLGHQIKSNGIVLSVGDLPATTADRVSMEQIFMNLVGNAVNYMAPGRTGRIEISGETRQDENVFFVRDNGRGIEKLNIESVFNILERLDTGSIKGEGMGLAFVRTLVRRHGGEVTCESEYGTGSTFTFSISKRLI